MGLGNYNGRTTFVNISGGKFYTKQKDSDKVFFGFLEGTVTKIEFSDEEYQGQKFEVAKITMIDNDEKFLLQIRTDSGYFRNFCNSLRSGDPKQKIHLSPSSKEENGKTTTSMFVQQNGQWLKHAFTKDNPGDYPQLEKINFRGNDMWDGTKQIQYWKDWLLSIKFDHEAIAATPTSFDNSKPAADTIEPLDDLPF